MNQDVVKAKVYEFEKQAKDTSMQKFQQQTGYCSAIVCSIKHGYGRNNINQSKQQSRDHAKIVVA